MQGEGAGHLSPRAMVTAQQVVASRGGCHMVRELAVDLVRLIKGDWEVITRGGARHRAEKVILCQGTELGLGLLGARYLPPLDVWYTAQTVALMEVKTILFLTNPIIYISTFIFCYRLTRMRRPDWSRCPAW